MEAHESEKKEEQKALLDRFKETEKKYLVNQKKSCKSKQTIYRYYYQVKCNCKRIRNKSVNLSEENSNKLEQVQQEQAGKVQLLENELNVLQTKTKTIENIKSDYDHKIEALINEQKDIKANKDAMIDI